MGRIATARPLRKQASRALRRPRDGRASPAARTLEGGRGSVMARAQAHLQLPATLRVARSPSLRGGARSPSSGQAGLRPGAGGSEATEGRPLPSGPPHWRPTLHPGPLWRDRAGQWERLSLSPPLRSMGEAGQCEYLPRIQRVRAPQREGGNGRACAILRDAEGRCGAGIPGHLELAGSQRERGQKERDRLRSSSAQGRKAASWWPLRSLP